MDWIDVNLPWSQYSEEMPHVGAPDLNDRAQVVFGTTMGEVEDRICNYPYDDRLEGHRQALGILNASDGDVLLALDRFEQSRPKGESEPPPVVRCIRDYLLLKQITDWWYEQPELRQWEIAQAAAQAQWKDAHPTFRNQGLVQPGTLVELANGSRYLIGTINQLRGVCDDCVAFDSTAIVKRYAVLLNPDSLGLDTHIEE